MLWGMTTPTDPRDDPHLTALLTLACEAVLGRWRAQGWPTKKADPVEPAVDGTREEGVHDAALNSGGGSSIPNAEGKTSMPRDLSASVTTKSL
jgi:hypothetical protein